MDDYNARIEWALRITDDDPRPDGLVDALVEYHPAVSRHERGWITADVTLPAESLRQAAATALAVAEAASAEALDGADVLALEVLPTTEFDARNGLAPLPELGSVTQAAEILGISRQRVLQRLEAGTLPGRKAGNTWVVKTARTELLDAPGGQLVATVTAVAGEPYHHEGVEYWPVSGRSVQGGALRQAYAPRQSL